MKQCRRDGNQRECDESKSAMRALAVRLLLLFAAFCLLPTAFCLVSPPSRSGFGHCSCSLPSAYCLLPTAFCLVSPPSRSGYRHLSPTKARDHAFVDLAGDPHVVEIVFANFGELAGLVQLKDAAAFDIGRLARCNSQHKSNVIQPHAIAAAQPPCAHRVENCMN